MMTIFGICSSINGYNKGIYSTKERFEQTILTINSIKKIPNSYIILCENSEICDEFKIQIANMIDLYIYVDVNDGDKSYNESHQMVKIIESIKNLNYDIFFKISGRYYLKNDFNINQYKNDKINFREFNYNGRYCYSTVLYSFSKRHEEFMKSTYEKFHSDKKSIDIETGLHTLIHNNSVNKINHLGVAGNIAPSGEYLNH